jgi:hypothetical protein
MDFGRFFPQTGLVTLDTMKPQRQNDDGFWQKQLVWATFWAIFFTNPRGRPRQNDDGF